MMFRGKDGDHQLKLVRKVCLGLKYNPTPIFYKGISFFHRIVPTKFKAEALYIQYPSTVRMTYLLCSGKNPLQIDHCTQNIFT